MDKKKGNQKGRHLKMSILPRQEVIRELQRQIVTGALPAGQRLPTEVTLAKHFRVSRGTIRHALSELAALGVVELRPRVGCFAASVDRAPKQRLLAFLHPAEEEINGIIVGGLEERTEEVSCELGIGVLSRDLDKAAETVARLRTTGCCGIIFTPFIQPDYYERNSRILDLFENNQLPYVVVDTPIARDGVIRGDFVGNDGYSAMRELVKYLVAHGHRRIGSIRVFAGVYSSDQRFRGIFDQLAADELPLCGELHRVIANVPLSEQGRKMIRELMALPEPPTAVICTHDVIALNVLDELREMGMRMPEDVWLSGFDDRFYAETLRFSSIRQPLRLVGRRAVEILLEKQSVRRQEFLPCELKIRS